MGFGSSFSYYDLHRRNVQERRGIMKGKQKKTLLGASVVALCVSIAVGTAVGCAPQPTQTASTGGDKPAAEAAASDAATDAASYDGGNLGFFWPTTRRTCARR